jgi:hypothetical protein
MDLKTTYKVKGLGTEKTIESLIRIFTDESRERITSVEDRWNGNIPEGPIATVSALTVFAGGSEGRFADTWKQAFRNLNSVVVPAFVGIPKSDEEDAKKSLWSILSNNGRMAKLLVIHVGRRQS